MAESGNLFDLSPEDFEFTLKELDLDRTDPSRAKFLRDEYVNQNSLAGQMRGAFQEATEVPEGRERATILPMTKPEGMSGWEAIKSGEAELAVPGFLTGMAEEGLNTLTTGEKMRAGIGITDEEIENAALTLGMSSLAELPRSTARAMSSGVDMSTVSAGGAKPKGPRQVPTFQSKGQEPDTPNPIFGNKRIRDIFEEDRQDLLDVQAFDSQFLDEEDWSINLGNEYDVERLGYARNIPLHELAQIKLGNKKVEDVINYYGDDPTPDIINYVNSRLTRLDNDPDFNDYVRKLSNNPEFNPVEAAFDTSLPEGVAAEFRSPIAETVSQMDYPSKGIEGYQLISALQKNPSIRKAELDTVLDDIDPKARYSKEEVENIVADNTWITTAEVLDDRSSNSVRYGTYQRQRDLLDPEQDYFELVINSQRANESKGQFYAKGQHYDQNTLAHSRASVRTDETRGDKYVLVEELQTDLLQHGFEAPSKGRKIVTPEEAVQNTYAAREDWGLTNPADELLLQAIAEDKRYELFYDSPAVDNFIKEVGPENLLGRPDATLDDVKNRIGVNVGDIEDLATLYSNYLVGSPGTRLSPVSPEAWSIKDNLSDFYWNVLHKEINYGDTPVVSAPPVKKIEESVKLTLNGLIAEADWRGVDRIVIPPLERIVEKRFGFGSEDYKKAIDKKSGFYKTYVKSLDKAIKELEDEFGRDKISKRLVDMNYKATNIGSISDSLGGRLGFTPDYGWENYLRYDFYDDLYAFQNRIDDDIQAPSGLTAREVQEIKDTIERSTGLRTYQYREYLEQSDPDFTKFLKGRIPDLPVTGTEIDIKGLRQAGYDLSRPRFAEGGLAVDRQMRTLMAEGGLKDDGMMRDPVSGNEIPPGSMAEEVRDDIPAQLSEGEYVVPADVVKYFGVKFFEELRAEAKAGLSAMEQNGRIGGEPVPSGGPRQDMMSVTGGLTQEEMAQLEAIMSSGDPSMMTMAQGGVVPQQYGMPIAQPQVDPYAQQATMYGSGMSKGYADGGLEQEMETIESYRTFDPADYTLGYSFTDQGGGASSQTVVMLYGPNGEVVALMLPQDQARYNELLSQGYTTEQQTLKPGEEEEEKPEDNYGGLADGGQEGPFGGGTDGLAGLNDVNEDGKVDFGDTFLGDMLGFDGKLGIQGPGLKDSLAGARRGGKDTGGKGTGGKGTPSGTPSGGFESRDTDSIGSGISIDGLSMGEDFGGDGRGDTSTAPEGYGLGQEGKGVSTAPSTVGMSMGEPAPEDDGGRGTTGTAPEGYGLGGGGEGPGPSGPSGGTSGGGATGGGGADSGTGPSGGNASPGASGAGAPGVAGGEVGAGPGGSDAVGPMNKGGLATKRIKAKRKPTNMNKGGLASPKSKK